VPILEALANGDAASALGLVEAALARHGAHYALLVDKAIALGLSGRADDAIKAADRAIAQAGTLHPPEAVIARVEAMLWLGDRSPALRATEAALKVHPDHAGLHHLLGKVQLELSNATDAALSFSRALELAPGDYAATLGLVGALVFNLRLDDARAELDALAARVPKDAWITYQYGLIHEAAEEFEAAIAAYQDAIAQGSDVVTAFAHFQIGRIHLQQDRLDLARPHLETFIRLAPPHATPQRRYAEEQLSGKRRKP
jgi:tetratricopeptide (TPR) repeat protein